MPTNVIQLFSIDIILNQYIAITELPIYNKIKRNGWSAIAEPFIVQKKTCQTNNIDKMSNKSDSIDQESVKISKTNSREI